MPENKTQMTDATVDAFLSRLTPEKRANEARVLDALFQEVTGFQPRLWGESIIGYGHYHYRYASGREGDFLATGFSPRKRAFSIYIMPGYANFDTILKRLGKHKTGRSCLYVNKLADIDTGALKELVCAGLDDLATQWPIKPT